MKDIHKYQQELLIGVMSRNLPACVRRGNYRDLRRSAAVRILSEEYRVSLAKLEAEGALFTNDSCAFPYWADTDTRRVFALTQGLPGRNRKDYRSLLFEMETYLLEERVITDVGSPEVRPTTTDDPDVRGWYRSRKSHGIRLIIPEVETLVGRLRPGERLVIGGYAGSYKTVLLEHIVAATIRDTSIPVLFASASRSVNEVRARVLEAMCRHTTGTTEASEDDISRTQAQLQVIGYTSSTQRPSLSHLRQHIDEQFHGTDRTILLALDSLDGVAELVHPRSTNRNDSIASLLALLEYLADQWGERLTIISTIRFTESTFLKLRRRVDDWEWQRRRAGFGFLDVANGIIAERMKAEQLSQLTETWENASGRDELPPNWEVLRIEHEAQKTVLEEVERKLQEELANAWGDQSESPKGRYLVSAFQDPSEVERFFHVCLSLWAEPSGERTRPVLALVVKNRNEESMDDPCTIRFSNEGAVVQAFSLPDSDDQTASIDSLIGDHSND